MAALTGTWVVSTLPRAAAALGAPVVGCHSSSNSSILLSFSSRSTAPIALGCCLSGGSRPWESSTVRIPKWGSCHHRSAAGRKLSPPLMAAREAAQAEEGLEEEEASDDPTNGAVDETPSLLEEIKAALAANDEQSIAELEAHVSAVQSERDALAKQVASLIEESNTAKERLLRLNADFDNFRKRTQTEKANLSSTVRGDVIETLLPMVDNFERAKASIRVSTEGEEKIDKSYQGIYKQFVEIMKGLGVVPVETAGKRFDPNLHEAIMREESTEHDEDIVIQEFRRGFSIGNKLMRPAMVKVSAGPGKGGGSGQAVDGDQVDDVLELRGDEVQ